jgi:hypothetical protein
MVAPYYYDMVPGVDVFDLTRAIRIGDPIYKNPVASTMQLPLNANYAFIGVATGFIDPDGVPVSIIPKAVEGEWWKHKIIIADDPKQRFVIQEDGDILTDVRYGEYVDLVFPLPDPVTTGFDHSEVQIDSSSVTGGGPGQLKLIRPYQAPNNEVMTDYTIWEVEISNHQLG